MRQKSSVMLLRSILAVSSILAITLLLASCRPKHEPFPLEDVKSVSPPTNIQVLPAEKLEGVKITVKWDPSPDDRYANGTIALVPNAAIAKAMGIKYPLFRPDEQPIDNRVRYIILRAELQEGENVYDVSDDRFIQVGEAKESETEFDDTTSAFTVWWQARERKVMKLPRKLTAEGVDSEETSVELEKYRNDGWTPERHGQEQKLLRHGEEERGRENPRRAGDQRHARASRYGHPEKPDGTPVRELDSDSGTARRDVRKSRA